MPKLDKLYSTLSFSSMCKLAILTHPRHRTTWTTPIRGLSQRRVSCANKRASRDKYARGRLIVIADNSASQQPFPRVARTLLQRAAREFAMVMLKISPGRFRHRLTYFIAFVRRARAWWSTVAPATRAILFSPFLLVFAYLSHCSRLNYNARRNACFSSFARFFRSRSVFC